MLKKLMNIVLLLLVGVGGTLISLHYGIEFSSFPVGVLKAVFGISLLLFVDTAVFHEIKTMETLKRSALAYAIFYATNGFVIGICIALA